jgi:hypothetical protein
MILPRDCIQHRISEGKKSAFDQNAKTNLIYDDGVAAGWGWLTKKPASEQGCQMVSNQKFHFG